MNENLSVFSPRQVPLKASTCSFVPEPAGNKRETPQTNNKLNKPTNGTRTPTETNRRSLTHKTGQSGGNKGQHSASHEQGGIKVAGREQEGGAINGTDH